MTDTLTKLLGAVREVGEAAEPELEPTDECIHEVRLTRLWIVGLEERLIAERQS